jgi:hypothetical protein
MNPNLVLAIVQAAVELAYAGVNIKALIDEAQANGGQLSDETLQRVQQEVENANKLWTGDESG